MISAFLVLALMAPPPVANPGPFNATFSSGSITLGANTLTASGPVVLTGTADAAGNLTIPAAKATWPAVSTDLTVASPLGGSIPVKLTVQAHTSDVTGTIEPATGRLALATQAWADVTLSTTAPVPGGSTITCKLGTEAAPWPIALKTTGYDPVTGAATLVDDAFALPGASNCTGGFLAGLVAGLLPAAPSGNRLSLTGAIVPALRAPVPPVVDPGAPNTTTTTTKPPSGDANTPPASVSPAQAPPAARLTQARMRGSKLAVTASCPAGTQACRVALTVSTRKPPVRTLVTKTLSLAAGTTASTKLALKASLLRGRGTRALVTLRPLPSGAEQRLPVTLRKAA